jgi:hypothetical protein
MAHAIGAAQDMHSEIEQVGTFSSTNIIFQKMKIKTFSKSNLAHHFPPCHLFTCLPKIGSIAPSKRQFASPAPAFDTAAVGGP